MYVAKGIRGKVILTGLITLGLTFLLINFNITIKNNPAEEKVLAKYSEKGLFSHRAIK